MDCAQSATQRREHAIWPAFERLDAILDRAMQRARERFGAEAPAGWHTMGRILPGRGEG